MTHPSLRVAAILLLTSLSACESAADRALKNSPDFKAGYADGCASAGSQGANPRDNAPVRDEQAFQTNRAYQVGWRTGFGACRSYEGPSSAPRLPGQGPIPDPSPHPF